jgi:hypothetical protein
MFEWQCHYHPLRHLSGQMIHSRRQTKRYHLTKTERPGLRGRELDLWVWLTSSHSCV